MTLLRALLALLFPQRDSQKLLAGFSLHELEVLAKPVEAAPGIVSLLSYQHPQVRAAILEAKFYDSRAVHELLGQLLAQYLSTQCPEAVLVPIPLSPRRRRERGYNQCVRIVEQAQASFPPLRLATDLLVRVRHTLPQTSLSSHDRHLNLTGAFALATTPDPEHTYIVFDDVLTTGATLTAALQALKEGGVPRVYGLSLAH